MLKDITLGQYFPGKTVVHRLDPRTKLLMTILYIVALFVADSWLSYGLVLAFLVGAVYFGVMAVYGATTNRSLVGWGPKLMGGLIAMIICSLVGSLFSLFGFSFGIGDLLLCAVGLFLFMGLTAYDTQMLKHHYAYFGGDAAMLHKASIIGALNLYLDFINIFLYVVRLLGRRRDS